MARTIPQGPEGGGAAGPGPPGVPAGKARRIIERGPYRNRFYFGNPLHRENIQVALAALGDLRDATVLDYGCGARVLTTQILAGSARRVIAVDADVEALKSLRSRLPEPMRRQVLVVASDAHALALRSDGVDAVFGLGVLHHLDLARALPEIGRVLKGGGPAAFVEPLGHNPIVNLFRRLTPRMRDRDEHPLTMEDLARMRSVFDPFGHRETQLLSLGALALRSVPKAGERLFRLAIVPLAAADRLLLRAAPFLGKYAWTTVITCRRRPASPDQRRLP